MARQITGRTSWNVKTEKVLYSASHWTKTLAKGAKGNVAKSQKKKENLKQQHNLVEGGVRA